MASQISFPLYDAFGAPLLAAVPTFLHYVDKTGAARTPPAITDLGGGQYGFTPSDADEAVGTCYVVDGTASASPRYFYAPISTAANQFALFVVFDVEGEPAVGAPTVGLYADFTGSARPPPSVVMVGAIPELYTITPTAPDVTIGVAWRLDAAGGTRPAFLAGSFVGAGSNTTAPIVDNFSPTVGGPIANAETISFDVTDDLGAFRRIVVGMQFPNIKTYDVAHDGSSFGNRYLGPFNSRVPITNGFRYTLLRDSGWPSSPRVVPIAIDEDGNENPVESQTYAWTLI